MSMGLSYAEDDISKLEMATPSDLEAETRPVEAYISPGHLFWHDFWHEDGAELSKIYQPLTAYDKPNGKEIGKVVMSKPQCFSKTIQALSSEDYMALCEDAGKHSLVIGSKSYTLFTDEYGYEESGLITFSPVILAGDGAWSSIEYKKGKFWVYTLLKDVYYYEERAFLIGKFDTWCSDLGKCAPLSKTMKNEMLKLKPEGQDAGHFAGCYQEVYEITGLAKFGDKNYYQVKMAELTENAPKVKLPLTGYIPTRNTDGSHTGYFFARGC